MNSKLEFWFCFWTWVAKGFFEIPSAIPDHFDSSSAHQRLLRDMVSHAACEVLLLPRLLLSQFDS